MTNSNQRPADNPKAHFDDLEEERERLRLLEKRLHAEAYDKVHRINRELIQQRYITRNREKEIARLESAKPWASMTVLIVMTTVAFGLGVIVGLTMAA